MLDASIKKDDEEKLKNSLPNKDLKKEVVNIPGNKNDDRRDKYKADEMEFESSPLENMIKFVPSSKNDFHNIGGAAAGQKNAVDKGRIEINKKPSK